MVEALEAVRASSEGLWGARRPMRAWGEGRLTKEWRMWKDAEGSGRPGNAGYKEAR
jgi:hypothetical protein